jgi:flagellar hook capping protein FlgD
MSFDRGLPAMRHVVVRCCVIAAMIMGVSLAWAFSAGPPANRTNAFPIGAFPVEPNCTQCHSGNALNDPNGLVEILDLPHIYAPGQTYSLRVRLNYVLADTVGTSNPKWGFELTAVRADSGLGAGTFVVPPGAPLRIIVPTTGLFVSSKRQYIEQVSAGTFTDQLGPVEWGFDWVAPQTAQGRIYFFAAGNAANGDGSTSGDHIFTAIDTMEAAVPGDVPIASHGLDLRLDAPRPNPSLHGTTLAYTLPRAGRVTLMVFDATGRRVRTVFDAEQPAGAGQVRWDATNEAGARVPAGAYFARLALNGTQMVTRKVTIAR